MRIFKKRGCNFSLNLISAEGYQIALLRGTEMKKINEILRRATPFYNAVD
jgi:hypothetical protein